MYRLMSPLLAFALMLAGSASAFQPGASVVPHRSLAASSSCALRPAPLALRMMQGGPPAAEAEAGPLTFTAEMRNKAMSLHTFSQAPKQGKQRDTRNTQMADWQTTKEDFLQFLVDNKVVYEAFEKAVKMPGLTAFENTGLERVAALDEDISTFTTKFGLKVPSHSVEAQNYADFIVSQAKTNPPVFVCHFYNYYFAHTAGGRMIGQKVMDQLLEGELIEFYKWKGDVKEILAEVKTRIDTVADGWSRAEKDASLDATPDTFMKSGLLLRTLVGKAKDRAARMNNKVTKKGEYITSLSPSTYTQLKKPWDV